MNDEQGNNKQIFVEFNENEGKRYRWIAVTSLLLAIGAILHFVVPSVAGVSPNFMISMYVIAINLTRPSLLESAGIGLVAGIINIPTSKSAFPLANLPSELIGAICCALMIHFFTQLSLGKFKLLPGLSAGVSTLASGFVFTGILKYVLALPWSVYLGGMVPVVIIVALLNVVITQVLYYPAEKLFNRREREL